MPVNIGAKIFRATGTVMCRECKVIFTYITRDPGSYDFSFIRR
jgi:hypothetical protein